MEQGEWIAIGGIAVGLLCTTIGSALYVAFKIGGVNQKVTSLEVAVQEIRHDISEIRTDIAEMKVKVDVLWHDHLTS